MPFYRDNEALGYVEPGHPQNITITPDAEALAAKPFVPAHSTQETAPALLEPAKALSGAPAENVDLRPSPAVPDASRVAEIGPGPEVVPSTPPARDPSILAAAFRQYNPLTNAISYLSRESEFGRVDPDFDAFAAIKGSELEEFWENFVGVRNAAEFESVRGRVEQEVADRRTLENGGWTGSVASLAASLVDPTILLPVGTIYRGIRGIDAGRSALRTAASVGAASGGAAALQETALQANQELRTAAESAAVIGGSTVLGGILGAGLSGLSTRAFMKLAERLETEMRVPARGADDAFGMGGLDAVRAGDGKLRGVGAAAISDTDRPDAVLKGALGAERGMSFQDPVLRTLNSQLRSVREIGTQLFETVLGLTRNADGVTTAPVGGAVETRIKTKTMAPLGESAREMDRLFGEYRFGNAGARMAPVRAFAENVAGRSQKLTYKQFKEEVGRAMARNDEHAIPEVAKAAKVFRQKLFDPHLREAVRLGLLPEELLGKGAKAPTSSAPRAASGVTDPANLLVDAIMAQKRLVDATIGEIDPDVVGAATRSAGDAYQTLEAAVGPDVARAWLEAADAALRSIGLDGDAIRVAAEAVVTGERAAGGEAARVFPADVAAEVWDDAGQSYITRVYNKEMIRARYPAFKKIIHEYLLASQQRAAAVLNRLERTGVGAGRDVEDLRQFAGLHSDELADDAAKIISHILSHPDGRMVFDLPPGVAGPLKARTLRIRDELIEDFLERDIGKISRFYARSVGPDLQMVRMFGSLDMKDQFIKIADEADRLASAAKTVAESKAIIQAKEDAIRDLTAMAERLRGTYAVPDDPTAFWPRAGRTVRTLNYLRLLGGMTISALPDTFGVMLHHGVRSYFMDGLTPLVANLKAVKLAGEEVKLAGGALDMVLDTRAMALADVLDDFGTYSKFERAIDAAQSNFGVLSLMAPWNAGMKQWVGMITMSKIVRACMRVAEGGASKVDVERLAASSIDDFHARIIAGQFVKHGRIESRVHLPNTTAWDVADRNVLNALEAFRGAVVRDVDRIIITPGQDKPLWMSTELGKVVGQFKSFAFGSVQRTVLAGLQQRDAGVLVGMMGMLSMGMLVEYLKAWIAGKESPSNAAQMISAGISNSGLTAYLYDVSNFAERMTGGAVGISRLTGREVSRYAARNWADAALGPTAGLVQSLVTASGGFSRSALEGEDVLESDIRALRRVLPYQNLFYLSWLFRQLEEGAAYAVDAKASK